MKIDGPNPAEFDELVHSRVRLGILTVLATLDWADFTHLRERLAVSDGNLATHIRRLLDAGLVEQHKRFVGDRPNTRYRLTRHGRMALENHLDRLAALVSSLRNAGKS